MNIKIYIVGHKDFVMIPSGGIFQKFHVGRNGKNENFAHLADDEGENISSKNYSFCELTALYWIWKNTGGQDYVGIFHYRRHLDFSSERKKADKWGVVPYKVMNSQYIAESALNDEAVHETLKGYDIILPEEFPVCNTKAGSTIIKHYGNSEYHNLVDYETAISVVKEKYPDYAFYCDKVSQAKSAYFCNLFIMRRSLFDKYCAWLFDILFELEKRIDVSKRSVQEKRVFGYLSERLFNIFFEKLRADNPNLRVKVLQPTFIKSTAPLHKILPFYPYNAVAIVMAFNNAFAPYAGVTLRSIVDHAATDKNYDIVIFNNGISEGNKRLLSAVVGNFPNFNIRYIDTEELLSGAEFPTHLHISKDTYCRLLIPEVFSAYEKIIYIDADMIVRKDISLLFDIGLNGKALAAVLCCIMAGFRKFKVLSIPDKVEAEIYLKKILGLNYPENYFQMGIIVFSIAEARKKSAEINKIIASGRQYWFMDQDILNLVYQGDIVSLDPRWNVVNGNGNTQTFFMKLPEPEKSIYFESRKDPFVIHFAGENKPWLIDKGDFHDYFWQFARQTPWYEKILRHFALGSSDRVNLLKREKIKLYDKAKRELKRVMKQVFHFIDFRK